MSDMVTIDFPREDVREMFRAIQRAEREVGRGLGNAVRQAGYHLARSLGTSTKVSQRYRDFRELETSRRRQKKFLVSSYLSGSRQDFETYKRGVRELRRTSALIARRGLAKGSWLWGARAAGQASAVARGGTRPSAIAFARRFASGDAVYRGNDPYLRIRNTLPYITTAMEGGERSLTDAMARGARSLNRALDDALRAQQLGS
jgi:hypothetical protein